MNYKLSSFIIFIFLVCSFSFVYASSQTLPLLGKVIYIDIGHDRYG